MQTHPELSCNIKQQAQDHYSRTRIELKAGTQQHLDNQLLNCVLDRLNLALELARLAGGDAGRDDRAGDVAGTAEGSLGGDEDVGDVLRHESKPRRDNENENTVSG